ncbi:MAG: hypothetical protein HZA29_04925 [Candidatus Omnitrophica bacterium]|nr:hypothetical protein [Candidatus Omnitrophota bacterium]
MAAGVAHEINNPMGFISSNMDVLGQYVDDYGKVLVMANRLKESVQEENLPKAKSIAGEMTGLEAEINLDYIMRDVDHLLADNQKGMGRIRKIITDLRTFAREDRGGMELVKIEDILEAILTILQGEILHKTEFKKHYGDTPFIQCNPQRISQVFISLFLNALQAVDEGGVIEITTSRRDQNVRVDIRNTGKPPMTPPFGGILAKGGREIVKRHGGDILVRSRPGEGTTFTTLLPITRP